MRVRAGTEAWNTLLGLIPQDRLLLHHPLLHHPLNILGRHLLRALDRLHTRHPLLHKPFGPGLRVHPDEPVQSPRRNGHDAREQGAGDADAGAADGAEVLVVAGPADRGAVGVGAEGGLA